MSEKIELVDERHTALWERSINRASELGKKAIHMFTVGSLLAVPPAITILNDRPDEQNLKVASINVIQNGEAREDNVCPPESQFAILQIAGVGMTTVSDYAAKVSERIFGPQYDECEAALRNGEEGYTVTYYAELLHEFVEQNHLDSVIIFAHSFGGIAAVDIINIYSRLYPESTAKFAVIFFSSPAGAETLQLPSRIDAEALKRTPPSQGVVKIHTYGGTAFQEGINLFSKQTWDDAATNAAATPANLTQAQCKELLDGMDELSPEANKRVKLFEFVGDKDDQVIINDRAPWDIEKASGRKMDAVYNVTYPDNRFSRHAGFWRAEPKYFEVNREAAAETVADAQKALDFRPRRPIVTIGKGLAEKNIQRAA